MSLCLSGKFLFNKIKQMQIALSQQLREGTKKSHTMAENTGFISCFLKGVVEKSSYGKLLTDLYFVYSAMEEQIERLSAEGHPIISSINFKELYRKSALENDLSFYFGSDWESVIEISKSAQVYVERINQVALDQPELLIGHHYSRYIGDLSGGQLLKKITQKALNLKTEEGLSFYIFKDVKDEKDFKKSYRERINSLEIKQEMADMIVEEANKAFKYNMNMFKELEGSLILAIGKVLFGYVTKNIKKGSTE